MIDCDLDPSTKAFLQANVDPVFGFPSLVRFCWQTVKTILDTKGVECVWEEDEDETKELEEGVKSIPITNFFKRQVDMDGGPGAKKKPLPLHTFYSQRRLTKATLADFV